MMADFLNSSEKRLCILILISVKYFKKVRIKIPKLRPYFNLLFDSDPAECLQSILSRFLPNLLNSYFE